MKKLLLATTIAAAGLLPLTAMAAGTSSSGSGSNTTGQSQTGTSAQTGTGSSGQAGTSGQTGMAGDAKAWSDAKPIGKADIGGLAGRSVTSSKGEAIGRIDSVVTGADGQNYAVMDVGSFLAIGERSVAVPLDHLRQSDGDVVLMSPEGEGQLGSQPEYRAEQYRPYRSQ